MNLRTVEFQIVETSANIRRNGLMTAAAVTNAAACLFVLGAFALALWNLHSMTEQLSHESRIRIFLLKDVPIEEAQALESEVVTRFGDMIEERVLIPREQVLEEFILKFPSIPNAGLGEENNPFPHELQLKLKDPEEWREVTEFARADGRVDEVRSGRESGLEPLLKLRRMTRIGGIILVAFLGFATLLTISNTIRLTIYARRREIGIMQLVGATSRFIRFPFLLEGVFHGTLGALLGGAALLGGYTSLVSWVAETIPAFERWLIYSVDQLGILFGGLVAAGLLFGLIGSWMSVSRHLQSP